MADSPTAWDLDVRSFMSDLLRGHFASHPQADPGYVAEQATRMANQVQAIRLKQFKAPARFGAHAPDKLPQILPIGTRILGEDQVAASVLTLNERDGRAVYFGAWEGSDQLGFWPATDIDWEHLATLEPGAAPI